MKKRRIVAVLVALVLAVSVFGVVISYAAKNPGRIDGVNYSRIRENKDLSVKVEFTLGTSKFTGELQNGKTLSNYEIDKIIREVMNQMELTSGQLAYSEAVIEQAKRIRGFDPEMALRIGLNVAGYGTVADIYDMCTGKKDPSQVTASFIIGKLSGEALKVITGAKWAEIALNAFLASQDIVNEWERLTKEKEIAEEALKRSLILDLFYNECNARLKKAEEERGGNNWKMRVESLVESDKKLFGIAVKQYQRLTVFMERVESYGEKTSTNWSGIYRGTITLKIWHDLTSFDINFPVIFADSSPIFKRVETIYKLRPESEHEQSTLTKQITLNDAEIQIDKRNAVGTTLSKNVPLKGAEDVSAFNLAHKVSFALDSGMWKDGVLDISSGAAHYTSNISMVESCSGTMLEGNRYPAIMWNTHEVISYDVLKSPSYGWERRDLAGNGSYKVGKPALVDYRIYDDLRDNMLTLWIKNIERTAG